MTTLGDLIIDAINKLQIYELNNEIYIAVKDLLSIKSYSKGCNNAVGTLINRKRFDTKSIVFGAITNDQLAQHTKYSRKFSKYFVTISEVMKEFNKNEINTKYSIKQAPAIIDDNGFCFFKDGNGVEYNVEMRGERTKDGIYFKGKDLQSLFEMPSLCKNVADQTNSFIKEVHYQWYAPAGTDIINNKELFVTYKGLKKIINNASIGRAKEFSDWIDDIVFASVCGTKEQRIDASSKILDVGAKCLQSFMNKSASDVSCLYLIDIKRRVDDKNVYKYGFTKNLKRRFKEHVAKYGDNISLETFCLIPMKNLSDAETELKNCISDYIQTHVEFITDEELLFLCKEAQKNIKYVFNNISCRYCGDLDSIKLQYESIIKEKDYEIAIIKKEAELKLIAKDNQLLQKDLQIVESSKDNQIKDMKIELLELKLKMRLSPEQY